MEKKESAVAQGLKECMEDNLPSFVFIRPLGLNGPMPVRSIDEMSGAFIFFLDSHKEQIVVDGNAIYRIDPLNIPLLKVHLNNIMPERYKFHGRFGWLVPLGEPGMGIMDERELMRIRNIMFWESMIRVNQTGPIALWLLKRQKLICEINEQTDSVRNYLLNKQYLQDGKWAMQDMYSMIMALTQRIDSCMQIVKRGKDEVSGNICTENNIKLVECRMRLEQTLNQINMLNVLVQKNIDEIHAIESRQK